MLSWIICGLAFCICLFLAIDLGDLHHDAAAVETRTAPYGSMVVMDCHTDLESPVSYNWSKQGGVLPRDSSIQDVSWLNAVMVYVIL
jgi:hypothetical protein